MIKTLYPIRFGRVPHLRRAGFCADKVGNRILHLAEVEFAAVILQSGILIFSIQEQLF